MNDKTANRLINTGIALVGVGLIAALKFTDTESQELWTIGSVLVGIGIPQLTGLRDLRSPRRLPDG